MDLPTHLPIAPAELLVALNRLRGDPSWPAGIVIQNERQSGNVTGEGGFTPSPFLLLPGRGSITTFRAAAPETPIPVPPGAALLFRPHSWAWVRKATGCRLLRFTFEPDRLVAALREGENGNPLRLCVIRQPPSRLMEELLAMLQPGLDAATARHALALLMAETARMLATAPAIGESGPRERFLLIDQFLREHLDQPMSRQTCARALGLSPTHISRLFQRFSTVTFQQRLEHLRLERAQTLLRETEMPVTDIAVACGYTSDAYFVRVFREKQGATPARWRARSRPIKQTLSKRDRATRSRDRE